MRVHVLGLVVLAAALCAVACGGAGQGPGREVEGEASQDVLAEGVWDSLSEAAGEAGTDETTADPVPDGAKDLANVEESMADEALGDEGGQEADGGAPDEEETELDENVDGDAPSSDGDAGDGEWDGGEECEGGSCQPPCPDDGLDCTDEVRVDGDCVPVPRAGYCLIDGACRFTFEPDPLNACLFCVPEVAVDRFVPHAGLPCDDGEPCTEGDECSMDGSCAPGKPADCDDGNVCTTDICTPGLGCSHKANQLACDDGKGLCTYQKQCSAGKCLGKVLPCKDSNECTEDSCDPATGCVFTVMVGAACSDGMPCTTGDACTAEGTCVGVPTDCDDHNPCTSEYCTPATGQCAYQPKYGLCDDGNRCTVNDHCVAGPSCTGDERICDDGNPCTDDTCDPEEGCVFQPNVDPCDDGDPCTEGDTCSLGECAGMPKDCADANACTEDSCDRDKGCVHLATFGPCEDGNLCTVGETCGMAGHVGSCTGGVNVDCDDGETCTYDRCVPDKGCVHEPVAEPCDDMNPCTENDHCSGGACSGTPRDCDDGIACTSDWCAPDGSCRHEVLADGSPCDDGNRCLVDRRCKAGVCVGANATCDDGNPCSIDLCDPALGCRWEAITTGPCDDKSVCTLGDHCEAGQCVGTSRPCSDGNPCTDDRCDPVAGCHYPPNQLPCDDGDPCTAPDTCGGGACTSTSVFTDPVAKTAKLSFGTSGNPGQGLNVDQVSGTCSPKGSCASGIDNAFAKLAWLFNPELTEAVADGTAGVIFEREVDSTGATTALNVFWARVAGPPGCDPAGPGCIYRVYASDVVGSCGARWHLDNPVIDGTHLTAGGKDSEAPFYLVIGDMRLPVTLRWAAMDASVSFNGGGIVSGSGVLAGALVRQELIDAVAGAPAEGFPPPYTREVLVQYLTKYVVPDIDSNGDGMKDAISVGMPFTLVTGKVIGYQ